MQNVVINTCEKFHYDQLRNDRALGNGKYDNNNKNSVRSPWRPVSGSKSCLVLNHKLINMYHNEPQTVHAVAAVVQCWQSIRMYFFRISLELFLDPETKKTGRFRPTDLT